MPHDHDHDGHGHGHGGHSHGVSADADRSKLAIALGLILAFMAFEVTVGIIFHSLALLSDAAHMLTDAAHMLTDAGAIALSLVALRLTAGPAKGALTFGLKRTEILSAQFNGATLLVLGLLIIYEGISRVVNPPNVGGTAVLVVALVGIVVNLAATYTLSKANRQSMNVEGAFQHILTGLAAFIYTAIAGALIMLTGVHRADGIASLIIAAIMLHAADGLLNASGRMSLEAAPEGIDPDAIGKHMAALTGVAEVYDLHVWEVTPASRHSPPTYWCTRTATATTSDVNSSASSTTSSTSTTPPSRSTTSTTASNRRPVAGVSRLAKSGRVVVDGRGPALPLAQAWWRLQLFRLSPLSGTIIEPP